jgi:hypothetical protein
MHNIIHENLFCRSLLSPISPIFSVILNLCLNAKKLRTNDMLTFKAICRISVVYKTQASSIN